VSSTTPHEWDDECGDEEAVIIQDIFGSCDDGCMHRQTMFRVHITDDEHLSSSSLYRHDSCNSSSTGTTTTNDETSLCIYKYLFWSQPSSIIWHEAGIEYCEDEAHADPDGVDFEQKEQKT
jgi:hypothetical protein